MALPIFFVGFVLAALPLLNARRCSSEEEYQSFTRGLFVPAQAGEGHDVCRLRLARQRSQAQRTSTTRVYARALNRHGVFLGDGTEWPCGCARAEPASASRHEAFRRRVLRR
jgi:hypothetical protein